MEAKIVYITCPDLASARGIGQVIVEERWAACANILPQIESIYHWDGKMVSEQEAVLLLKTTTRLIPTLIDRVVALHPYDLPAILVLDTAPFFPPYLDWISQEVTPYE